MTSLSRANGFFASAFAEGFSMLRRPRSIGQTLVPALGFVALANVGCATSIAAKYPHLDRRAVCVLPPEIEQDSTEFVFADANVPISNFHPEVVDRVAAEARTVFEYDPDADPSSVRDLPAPYNRLTCPERFSPLPSKDAETPPLPEASVDLLVHERRPERVPLAVAEKLANCAIQSSGELKPIQYTATLNVYVTTGGQAVSAIVVESTLGDRPIERCIVNALRKTQWPVLAAAPTAASTASTVPALKTFLAQPAPAGPSPDSGPISEIRVKQPWAPPASDPGGVRVPRVFVIPLGPLAAAAAVFGIIYFWSDNDAPAWSDELNPITGLPYTRLAEYEAVRRLTPQQILQQQQAHIKATQPQAPPAPAPAPSPQPQPQPEPQKQPECPRNEIFVPIRTDNATGCTDKKGNVRCYSSKHRPCAGVHTHGKLRYQEIRNGVCKSIERKAVRCDGPFEVSGQCGSVSTVECNSGGSQTSGIHEE